MHSIVLIGFMLRRIRSHINASKIYKTTVFPKWANKKNIVKCIQKIEMLRFELINSNSLDSDLQKLSALAIIENLLSEQKSPSFYCDNFFEASDENNIINTDKWLDTSLILDLIIESWVTFHTKKMSSESSFDFNVRHDLLKNLAFYSLLFDSRTTELNRYIQNYFHHKEISSFNLLPIPSIEFASRINPYSNPHSEEYLKALTLFNSQQITHSKALDLDKCDRIIKLLKDNFCHAGDSDFSMFQFGKFVENNA